MGWMVPEIDFNNGYCLEGCNLCSQVCPSGAITLFGKDAKAQLKIGLAEVLPENCLLTEHKECDRCKSACSYEAITIEAVRDFTALPVINTDRCVGCGACFVICPPVTIKMKI
jgi:Fe-S-cluster-containing hydrogenase component 2